MITVSPPGALRQKFVRRFRLNTLIAQLLIRIIGKSDARIVCWHTGAQRAGSGQLFSLATLWTLSGLPYGAAPFRRAP